MGAYTALICFVYLNDKLSSTWIISYSVSMQYSKQGHLSIWGAVHYNSIQLIITVKISAITVTYMNRKGEPFLNLPIFVYLFVFQVKFIVSRADGKN